MKSRVHNNMARTVALAAACVIGSNVFADTATKDVKDELVNASNAIQEYSADRKDEAVSKAKAAMSELDASIEKLETSIESKSAEMSQATRRKAGKAMKELRQQRSELAEWYGGLKHSSSDAWEQVKEGFSESYSALVDSWDKAQQEFESGS